MEFIVGILVVGALVFFGWKAIKSGKVKPTGKPGSGGTGGTGTGEGSGRNPKYPDIIDKPE
jgi:hypothetical protein